jgi:putative methyltransferase
MQNKVISENYSFGKIIYSRRPVAEVVNELANPFMVMFSCSVWNMEYNKTVAQKIKAIHPDCLILFGGHSISSDGKDLEKYDYVDFLVHRFGEEPTEGILESIASEKDLRFVPNISYRTKEGEIITTKYEPQTKSDYPSPYLTGVFDEILKDDIKFSGLFESNRGCPNACSFCDWSSLRSKVRLFPMERVIAEINWFVDNKIEYIYCTDANFCLFDRDAEIADYVVECKEKYGYPQIFKAFFTKNRFNFVFDVSTKFFTSGLDKAKTISFQSMNQEVLKNIGRKNISTDKFRELMKKYNELNISTFSELILGLPGETYTSFCEGVKDLIENGQHFAINIYPCELLPNSEMGQKEYQKKFGIKSTRVPFKLIHSNSSQDKNEITEYSEYITSTDTMSSDEWVRALLFSSYIQGLHNLGLLRAVAIYLRHEENIDYDKFYNMLIDYSEKHTGTILNKVYTHIKDLCFGIISGTNGLVSTCDGLGEMWWGFDEIIFLEFYKELDVFYKEVQAFVTSEISDDAVVPSLFDYQYSIIKKINADTITISNDYDFYSYYNRIYLKQYAKLEKKETALKIQDTSAVANLKDFAREVIWYGRNRRATDYTSTHYKVNTL